MTVIGAGEAGEGSKVAQYGSTAAEAALKMGNFRLTGIGEVLSAVASAIVPSEEVELTGTR
jgi:hypothetical protein